MLEATGVPNFQLVRKTGWDANQNEVTLENFKAKIKKYTCKIRMSEMFLVIVMLAI